MWERAGGSGTLADPSLEWHDGNGAIIASSANWNESQQAEIVAATLAPADDRVSALVRGKIGAPGVGLVKVYNIK